MDCKSEFYFFLSFWLLIFLGLRCSKYEQLDHASSTLKKEEEEEVIAFIFNRRSASPPGLRHLIFYFVIYFFPQFKLKFIKISSFKIYLGYYFIKYCLILLFFKIKL